jgi:hypothetical protein
MRHHVPAGSVPAPATTTGSGGGATNPVATTGGYATWGHGAGPDIMTGGHAIGGHGAGPDIMTGAGGREPICTR